MMSNEQPLLSLDTTTAPVRGIDAVKDPCLCGCLGINIPWFKKVRATPEFKVRLDQDVKTQDHDPAMLENLHWVKEQGRQIGAALERGECEEFGLRMHEHWCRKKERSRGISNAHIDELYETGCANGAVGGKLCPEVTESSENGAMTPFTLSFAR